MTREEFDKLRCGSVVCHIKYNQNYMLRDKHLKMKNPTTGEWIDAVTYVPMCENNEKLFCREESSFIEEFASNNEKAPAYTYEQMATLNLQLQGLVDAKDEAFFKLREECEYYKNQIKLIKKVIDG